jgi:hypothetical protein
MIPLTLWESDFWLHLEKDPCTEACLPRHRQEPLECSSHCEQEPKTSCTVDAKWQQSFLTVSAELSVPIIAGRKTRETLGPIPGVYCCPEHQWKWLSLMIEGFPRASSSLNGSSRDGTNTDQVARYIAVPYAHANACAGSESWRRSRHTSLVRYRSLWCVPGVMSLAVRMTGAHP